MSNLSLGAQSVPAAEYIVVGNAALAVSSMARNGKFGDTRRSDVVTVIEMNQNDLLKAGAIDLLVKLLSVDNSDIRKSVLLALTQLCSHSGREKKH